MKSKRFVNDPSSPSRRRALALARAVEELHAKLMKARELQRMTQSQIADLMGVTQPTVAAFERYDNDAKLSSVIRYAHAVGATISMSVTLDGAEVELGWSPIAQVVVPCGRASVRGSRATAAPTLVQLPMAA